MTPGSIRRVSVVGSSGSGKTTFAAQIAARLGVPHIELDAIWWGPNWTHLDAETFAAKVDVATAADAWVCDGNFSAVRQIVLERADTVVGWTSHCEHVWRGCCGGRRAGSGAARSSGEAIARGGGKCLLVETRSSGGWSASTAASVATTRRDLRPWIRADCAFSGFGPRPMPSGG